MIYPIASRCGVFAKTDIQPLLNEGAAKEDIAASIFQAVVNQTISGLACGRPIRGNVAFLGGPLNYLSELRQRFIETLNLSSEQIIVPNEAHLLVAKGAALDSLNTSTISVEKLKSKIEVLKNSHDDTTKPLSPLFSIDADYDEFKERHDKDKVKKGDLSNFSDQLVYCFLFIHCVKFSCQVATFRAMSSLLEPTISSSKALPPPSDDVSIVTVALFHL